MSGLAMPRRFAVLVVEDEPLIRLDVIDLVEEAGFIAYGASNADEAIVLLERHPEIRVLVTDIEMPGSMTGLKLAHAVRARWPPIAIIVVSGRGDVSEAELPAKAAFVAKPYKPRQIKAALSQAAASIAA